MSNCAARIGQPAWQGRDRVLALKSMEILDTEPEATFDGLTKIAAQICGAPIAVINFIDDHRQWFKSAIGTDMQETPLDVSICIHGDPQQGLFVVPNLAEDSRFKDHPFVKSEPRIRFYAGAPLMTREGAALGTLCIVDYAPRPEGLTEHQTETLLALANAVVNQLEVRLFSKAMARREAAARETAEAIPQMVWSARRDGTNDYYNKRWYDFTGAPLGSANGEGWNTVVHPADRDQAQARWFHSVETGEAYEAKYRLRHLSGAYRWVLARSLPKQDEQGRIERWFGTYTDIHDLKETEQALATSEERLRLALNAAQMVAWEFDPSTNELRFSKDSIHIGTGLTKLSDFLGIIHQNDRAEVEQFFKNVGEAGPSTVECRYTSPTSGVRWFGTRAEKAGPNRIVGVTFDITDRKKAEEEFWRLANHDPLTGLPNRILFQIRLEEALAEAKREGTGISLLLIDLDDFKDVNDTLGHDAGDAVLKETAARLSAISSQSDTIARLGGDEFAILLIEPQGAQRAIQFASLLLKEMRKPFLYSKRTLISRASIGIASYPEHDAEAVELMKDADVALYHAKAQGRSRAACYSSSMRKEIEERVSLWQDVREAIVSDQIIPYYQPKVCLKTGRIVGLEALARWQHPSRGLQGPEIFGAAFDDHELATAIGKLLMSKVASDMRQWLDSGIDFGRVAVNLSPAEVSQPDLAEQILRILDWAKVPTTHFEVEVTESVLLGRDSDGISAILRQLRQNGIQVALDDFGTGYASLTHLKRFPVDHVKIDQSFVRDLERDLGDEAIVRAVIGLGQSLQLRVTAEGVETLGQAQRLRELGCNDGQGFLYAKPLESAQVPALLAGWNARLVNGSPSKQVGRYCLASEHECAQLRKAAAC